MTTRKSSSHSAPNTADAAAEPGPATPASSEYRCAMPGDRGDQTSLSHLHQLFPQRPAARRVARSAPVVAGIVPDHRP